VIAPNCYRTAFMTEATMGHLYFRAHGKDLHPHPRTRLLFLLMQLKAAHPGFAVQLDTISRHCHIFFDNVWTAVAEHFPRQKVNVSPTWGPVVELHRRAHTAPPVPSSTKEP